MADRCHAGQEFDVMQFGLYLHKKGVITAQQLVAALEVQQKQLVRIGQLAIEEGVLTPRQVFQVLQSQSHTPHERFGEVALGQGLMTRDQLQGLLMLQMDRKRSLGEILIQQRAISPLAAAEELATYRREMELRSGVVRGPSFATPRRSIAASVRNLRPEGQFATGL
jgi:hypothetical protein